MATTRSHSTAFVNQPDDWQQDVVVSAPDAGGDEHTVTPASGKVRIYYVDGDGVTQYYDDATQSFTTTPTVNDTNINGTISSLPYTHLPETNGRIVYFEGWIVRGGKKAPTYRHSVLVQQVARPHLQF